MIIKNLIMSGMVMMGIMHGGGHTPINQPDKVKYDYDSVRYSVVDVHGKLTTAVEIDKNEFGRVDKIWEMPFKTHKGDIIQVTYAEDDLVYARKIKSDKQLTQKEIGLLPDEVKVINDFTGKAEYYLLTYKGYYEKE